MKSNEKGKLSIEVGKDNKSTVVFCPADNTVWMDKNDLCELFGVYMPIIDACLNTIFKTNMFYLPEVCEYDLLCERNRMSHAVTAVNLDVIIVMAFRIESGNAGILRNWFFERFREPKLVNLPLNLTQNYLLN